MTQDSTRTHIIEGRVIVGCDGANSLIRGAIGAGQEDRGFEADWLVIDAVLRDGVSIEALGIPEAAQYCNPAQPTTIGPGGLRGGRAYRRWEFMRQPGVSVEELADERKVWDLLSPWAGPEHLELVRHKVYTFRSLLATRWRDRRLLIAGDAAHVMPPFLGQGLCSGIRDAWNLAWKLALTLDGVADERLLDTYQSERAAHVGALIDASIHLGKIICIPDPEAAAARDALFLSGNYPPLPEFPRLSDGLLLRLDDGAVADGAGQLAPHVTLRNGSEIGALDAVFGARFLLLATSDVRIGAGNRARLAAIGARVLVFAAGHLEDLDRRIEQFLHANGWTAALVRPDFYVFGGVANLDDVEGLLDRFFQQSAEVGLSLDR